MQTCGLNFFVIIDEAYIQFKSRNEVSDIYISSGYSR